MRKIKLILFSSALSLPLYAISCSSSNITPKTISLMSANKLESYILKNIELNTSKITIYDALLDLNSALPLKIVNNLAFKKLKINLSFLSTELDYDKRQLIINLFYKLANKHEGSIIKIVKPFSEFKEIEREDWKRIFNNMAKISQIEWYEKNEMENEMLKVSNKYATVSKVSSNVINSKQATSADILYHLQINNSKIITNEEEDKKSSSLLSGGILTIKRKVPIRFKYPYNEIKEIIVESYLDEIKPPSEIPTLENHIFMGWSLNPETKIAHSFNFPLDESYDENITFYPIFKKKATLVVNIPSFEDDKIKKKELIVEEGINKEDILNFINESRPQPEDKWSYSFDKLQFLDQNNQMFDFEFDQEEKLKNKLDLDCEYLINVEYKHKPVFIFLEAENEEFLAYEWIEQEIDSNLYYTPKINIDFEALELKGKYPISYLYKDNSEKYIPKTLIDNYSEVENQKIYVLINFMQTKSVTIDAKVLDKDKLATANLYLTPEGKLKEKHLPQNINTTWYKGEDRRQFSDKDNNELFDRRSKKEKEIGLDFEGWYSDEALKDKIIFENGVSTTVINSKSIYPKFVLNKWEKIKNAREIIDAIFTLAETSIKAAAEVKNNEKAFTIAEHATKIVKWILYLLLAGKQTNEVFWEGFDNFAYLTVAINEKNEFITFKNIQEATDKANGINSIFWVNKEILRAITGINTIYSKDEFKNSVFINKEVLEGWTAKDVFNLEQNAIYNRNFLGYLIYKTLIDQNTATSGSSSGSGSETNQESYTTWTSNKGKNISYIIGALVNFGGVQDIIWNIKDLIINSQDKKNSIIALQIVNLADMLGRMIKTIVVNVLNNNNNGQQKK